MNLFRIIENNKLFAFITGTIIIQAFVLSTAAILHTPAFLKNINNERIIIAESSVAESNKLTSNLEAPAIGEELSNAERELNSIAPSNPDKIVLKDVPANKESASVESEFLSKTYKIVAGDTLTKIWVKNGASTIAGMKAAEAFKKAGVPLNNLRLGQEVQITMSATNTEVLEFSMKLPQRKSIKLTGNETDGYQATVEQAKVLERERRVSYPIINSFSESAHEVNVPSEIVDDLVDLFSGRLDFRKDLQPSDSFSVIYTERYTKDGETIEPGPIKAVSIETGGKLLVAIRHVGQDGKERYFNESGESLGNSFLRYPLRFTRISSIFSESRFHPILKIRRPHNGVDFAAPQGTPVRSIGDGVIEMASYGKGTGNIVKIRHDDRFTTAYMHLARFAPGMRTGARVSRGQQIGEVGMTGLATAPHLHFSLYDRNQFIDPMAANLPVFASKENAIPKTYLASTMQSLRQQHEFVRFASLMGLTKNV